MPSRSFGGAMPRVALRPCLAEERLCGCNAVVRAKQKVHGLAVLIHGAIEVVPFPSNTNIRLIDSPGGVHGACPTIPSLLELRYIMNPPPQDRRVGHTESALGHHGHQIPIAQPVGDVPADAQFDDLGLEPSAPVDWIAGLCLGHSDTPARPRASNRSSLMHQSLQ